MYNMDTLLCRNNGETSRVVLTQKIQNLGNTKKVFMILKNGFKKTHLPITNKQGTDSREVYFRGISGYSKSMENKHARHGWNHKIQLKVKM